MVQRVGSMLTLFFRTDPVRDFEGAAVADHKRFARFFNALLERGIHLPPSDDDFLAVGLWKVVDRRLFPGIDFIPEVTKDNVAAAIPAGVLLLFCAQLVSSGLN